MHGHSREPAVAQVDKAPQQGHFVTIEVDQYEFTLILKFYDETFHVLEISYRET